MVRLFSPKFQRTRNVKQIEEFHEKFEEKHLRQKNSVNLQSELAKFCTGNGYALKEQKILKFFVKPERVKIFILRLAFLNFGQ